MQVFKNCHAHNSGSDSFELSLITCKCIGAYARNKKNQNQVFLQSNYWIPNRLNYCSSVKFNCIQYFFSGIFSNWTTLLFRYAGCSKRSDQLMIGDSNVSLIAYNIKVVEYYVTNESLEKALWALEELVYIYTSFVH